MEIFYSDQIIPKLNRGELLTLANSNYVLIEFGTKESYEYIRESFDYLLNSGYIPVEAHFERYDKINSISKIEMLKNTGVIIQININSILKM